MLKLGRYLQLLALGIWLGGMVLFSFIVAPALFQLLPSSGLAAEVVSVILDRLYALGYICGGFYLLGLLLEQRFVRSRGLVGLAVEIGLVAGLLLVTLYSDFFLGERLAELRTQMKSLPGSLDLAAFDHPLRLAFSRYYRAALALLTGMMAGILILLGLTLRRCR